MRANYNPRNEHSIRKRYGFKNPKKSFLIICEGENTEPDYFNAFRLTSATVKAVGKGLGTMNLVKEAIIIRDREKNMGKSFDYCWVYLIKTITRILMNPFLMRRIMASTLPIVMNPSSSGSSSISAYL